MVDYEPSKVLSKHFKFKNMPARHWFENTSWEMSEHLHLCVLSRLRSAVQFARILSISCDEATVVDNTSWIGIHVYAIEGWERVLHLLHLSHVSNAGTASNLTQMLILLS